MRRARRPARRGSRGLRPWPCRRRGAGSARRTAGGVPSLAGDGGGEEQGVQWRAVEPFSRVGPGSYGEQRRPARLRDEPGERGSTVFGAHAALEDDRVVAQRAQCAGDRLQMAGPVGEDKAVPALAYGVCDVGDNLLVALAVVRQARAARAETIQVTSSKTRELHDELHQTQQAIVQRALSALTAISEALDKLNRKAGGLGARLDSEVIPPATPDQDWRTRVIPRWRRNPGGALLPYDNVTNTAQEKLFSIHLVLASLLAAPYPRGRILILDELAGLARRRTPPRSPRRHRHRGQAAWHHDPRNLPGRDNGRGPTTLRRDPLLPLPV